MGSSRKCCCCKNSNNNNNNGYDVRVSSINVLIPPQPPPPPAEQLLAGAGGSGGSGGSGGGGGGACACCWLVYFKYLMWPADPARMVKQRDSHLNACPCYLWKLLPHFFRRNSTLGGIGHTRTAVPGMYDPARMVEAARQLPEYLSSL